MADSTDNGGIALLFEPPPNQTCTWLKAFSKAVVVFLLLLATLVLLSYCAWLGRGWTDDVLFVAGYGLLLGLYVLFVAWFGVVVGRVLRRQTMLSRSALAAPVLLCVGFVGVAAWVSVVYVQTTVKHFSWHQLSVQEAIVVGSLVGAAAVDVLICILALALCLHPDYSRPQLQGYRSI